MTSIPPGLLFNLKSEGVGGVQFTHESTLPGMWGQGASAAGQAVGEGIGGGVLGLKELLMTQKYSGNAMC